MATWLDDLLGKTLLVNGVVLPDRKKLNFITALGGTVTGADNPGAGQSEITIGTTGVMPLLLSLNANGFGDPLDAREVDGGYQLANAQTGYTFDCTAGDLMVLTPATPVVGTVFNFACSYAGAIGAGHEILKVKANTGQTIRLAELVSASAGFVRTQSKGAMMQIVCVTTTTWDVTYFTNTWTVDV